MLVVVDINLMCFLVIQLSASNTIFMPQIYHYFIVRHIRALYCNLRLYYLFNAIDSILFRKKITASRSPETELELFYQIKQLHYPQVRIGHRFKITKHVNSSCWSFQICRDEFSRYFFLNGLSIDLRIKQYRSKEKSPHIIYAFG